MPDMQRLANEINLDPAGIGYAAMTPQQVLAALQANTRSVSVPLIEVRKIKKAIVYADWIAITQAQRDYVMMQITSETVVDNEEGNVRTGFATIFAGRPTLTAPTGGLAALLTRLTNRLEIAEIGQDVRLAEVLSALEGKW